MRRYFSDGPVYERRMQAFDRQENNDADFQRKGTIDFQAIMELIAQRAVHHDHRQFLQQLDRPQNRIAIWKTIAIALILMLITSTFDNNCEKIVEQQMSKTCLNSYIELGCSKYDKETIVMTESNSRKECERLESCLKDPQGYVGNRKKEEWMSLLDDAINFIKNGASKIWWISLLLAFGLFLLVVPVFF